MKKKKKWIFLTLTGLSILAVAVVFGNEAVNRSSGRIELSVTEYDFGTIPNTMPVSQVFQVRNIGRRTLEITGVSTSCGCTSAEINESNLLPGEETDLKVTYDPLAHHGTLGKLTRQVYVRSNDPDTPEAVLTIRMTVVEP